MAGTRRMVALVVLLAAGGVGRAGAEPPPVPPGWDEQVHADRCPAWAKEAVPAGLRPYLGRQGLPEPYNRRPGPLGAAVAGIDRWQANCFLAYRPETADFLYGPTAPARVTYRRGDLPTYEKLVAASTRGLTADRARARALLTGALGEHFLHPTMPPLGPPCRADRALLDEQLLRGGTGFCNEQARVYSRLCQVAGMPARIVHLFYADRRTGHTVSEVFVDGRWAMVDSTWLCVFPAADGHWMSAAECHESEANKRRVGEVYHARYQELLALPDERLVGRHFPGGDSAARRQQVGARAAAVRESLRRATAGSLGEQLWTFGIINNPLPR